MSAPREQGTPSHRDGTEVMPSEAIDVPEFIQAEESARTPRLGHRASGVTRDKGYIAPANRALQAYAGASSRRHRLLIASTAKTSVNIAIRTVAACACWKIDR